MKFLVTGTPGWLGTRFVKSICGTINELKELSPINHINEVRCLVLPNLDQKILESIHTKVKTIKGDITNKNSLIDFFNNSEGEILFHIAGIVHATNGIKQLFDVNLEGSKNILECAIKNKVKRIIVISSNSPAGNNPYKDHLFTEESPYNPYMSYGKSKMEMEILLKDAHQKGQIETVILRPCWFYGPDQPPRQTLFFSMVKNGKAPILGQGDNKRSMSYIDNICQGLLLASNSEKANGQTYWIADKRPYTMKEITDTIENLLENEFKFKVKHKRLKLPSIAGDIATCFDYVIQKCGLYHQKIHVLSEMNKTIACSIKKAEKELGYTPKIELEEGMRRSIKWCLDNGLTI